MLLAAEAIPDTRHHQISIDEWVKRFAPKRVDPGSNTARRCNAFWHRIGIMPSPREISDSRRGMNGCIRSAVKRDAVHSSPRSSLEGGYFMRTCATLSL
ncbi:hypothetical protein ABID19_002909 [Mesorhizobium robiniae]|uniref:Uncharacterized protein n=1 Tax=Mesorhizobium robiniae TaxID=559315 RepID=A0ABV2GNL3_9HYPH